MFFPAFLKSRQIDKPSLPGSIRSRIRIERRFGPLPPTVYIENEFVENARSRIIFTLITLDSLIFVAAGGLGYFLAGKTLDPIKEMVEEQNHFISDSSHELRTPLTAMKTSLEVALMNKKLSLPEAKETLKDNLSDVNNLQKLSDNLLTLNRLENYKNKDFKKLSLKRVLNTNLKRLTPLADTKKITIVTKINDYSVMGSETELGEVFSILIENAIKYSPENTKITISTKKTDHGVNIRFKDQGYGISSKDIPHIFDRFYRADQSRTKNIVSGFGLGLPIAKKIIAKHSGRISVVSQIEKGSEFNIYLPALS